jgi:hypothetical protein
LDPALVASSWTDKPAAMMEVALGTPAAHVLVSEFAKRAANENRSRKTPQHPVISFAAALRIPDAMPTYGY